MPRSIVAGLILAAMALAGCGGGHSTVAGPSTPLPATSRSPTPAPTSAPATPAPKPTTHRTAKPAAHAPVTPRATHRTAPPATAPSKMLVFVEENHSESQALAGMPYLASLANTYGRTTDYHAVTHPSLPNYLALGAGSTFGVEDDAGPSEHRIDGDSVFDEALHHERSAKAYDESMPDNSYQASSGSYAVKHNPWAYFGGTTQRANCRRFNVPMGTPGSGALSRDVAAGSLPQVGMAVPNLCNDAHSCSTSTADAWLHDWLLRVMTGPDYRAGRLAIVVTFDEDDRSSSNNVLTVVISPATSHVRSSAAYDHYSWLRCADDMLGLPPLRAAAAARSLCPAFHL